MLRHYIEGLVCATVAAIMFVRALRRGNISSEALSATAYSHRLRSIMSGIR